ncbi:MAG TPA: hypothetical protein VLK29_05620 [Luteimonas sp.]|nr:hypothetical protein [Luteimonas sp.]
MSPTGTGSLAESLRLTRLHADATAPGTPDPPVALLVPTTSDNLAEAARLRDAGSILLVADAAHPGATGPSDILLRLASAPGSRPDLVVFSDQILSAADANVLVHGDRIDAFVSPFEAVLNLKYGYCLGVWAPGGYRRIAPGTATPVVLAAVARHLLECDTLGDAWLVRHLQRLRSPARRRADARRKLRFFRSAISNVFRMSPDDPEARQMRDTVAALEHDIATREA